MEDEIFNFTDILKNRKEYNEVIENLEQEITEDFFSRKAPAIIQTPNFEIKATKGIIFLNLLIFNYFVEKDIILDKDDFILSKFSQEDLEEKFNKGIKKFQNMNGETFKTLKDDLGRTINKLAEVSVKANSLAGDSISFLDFVRLAHEKKEAKEIFYPKLKKNSQFNEIEQEFKNMGKKIEKFFLENDDTDLYPFISSKTGINMKQLTQSISFIGLKPDIDGSVIPVAINRNFLTGLGNLENYFINAKGTRKALITNKSMTRKSGYMTRKLSLLNIDNFHDDELNDCGTKHFIIYDVTDENKLKLIENRHYYELDQKTLKKKSEMLYCCHLENKELIGQKIGLRSPITCAGPHVCSTCYGKYLSKINKDIHTGLLATFKLTEPLTQRLLSAKHLLSTDTEKINWGRDFLDIFTINMNEIYFSGLEATIILKIPSIDDFDEDEEMYFLNSFSISLPTNKKAFDYLSPTKLFLNPKILENIDLRSVDSKNNEIKLNSENFSEDDFIFKFENKNNELIKSLTQIIDLIETKEHLGITNFNDMANKFVDLIIENKLSGIPSVHLEMILSKLVVDAETEKKLDFTKDELPEYKILRVSNAILNGPISVSLAFERLNDQLYNPKTYQKEEESLMDFLFK